jgi:hypothetical protein
MPEINKIPESSCLYNGNQPYHVHYDNLPLKNILKRIELVNYQVDINSDILRGANLSSRLVSLHDNGKIKTSAVNSSLHNIGHHTDGSYQGIDYVRMKKDERDKLELVNSEANKLYIEIEDKIDTSSTPVVSEIPEYYTIETGVLKFKSSDTIYFDFQAPTSEEIGQNVAGTIKAYSVFPLNSAHRHYYGLVPEHQDSVSPDYQNYITTSYPALASFSEESLRVYVNGVRLGTTETVNVPSTGPLVDGSNLAIVSNIIFGSNVKILSNVAIGSNITVVSNVSVGSNVTIGSNITVASNVTVGSNFNVSWKRLKIESQNSTSGTFSLNIPLEAGWRNITIDYDQTLISPPTS